MKIQNSKNVHLGMNFSSGQEFKLMISHWSSHELGWYIIIYNKIMVHDFEVSDFLKCRYNLKIWISIFADSWGYEQQCFTHEYFS